MLPHPRKKKKTDRPRINDKKPWVPFSIFYVFPVNRKHYRVVLVLQV